MCQCQLAQVREPPSDLACNRSGNELKLHKQEDEQHRMSSPSDSAYHKKRPWTGQSPSDIDAAQALINSSRKPEAKRPSHKQHDDPKRQRREDEGIVNDSYYGPAEGESSESKEQKKVKANFGLTGALAKDSTSTSGGNIYKGVALKFREPPEARTPKLQWRFYVFKGDDQVDTLHVSKQSAYLWGRNGDIADIHIQHPSCSSQHAVLQYRALPNKDGKLSCQPYLMDLEATNGTFLNSVRIDSARYYQLKSGDVLRFGSSTREYVLLNADSK